MVFTDINLGLFVLVLQVYHTLFWPLEWTVAGRDNNTCYAKIICNKSDNVRNMIGS